MNNKASLYIKIKTTCLKTALLYISFHILLIVYIYIYLRIRIFNVNPMILFSLYLSNNWHCYSMNTIINLLWIKNTIYCSFFTYLYMHGFAFLMRFQWSYFHLNRVSIDKVIPWILFINHIQPDLEVPKMATTSNSIHCHPPIPASPQHI